MKKLIMMMTAAIAAAIPLMAETETVGGYTWTYYINGDTAEIYNDWSAAISPSPTGAVTIPSTLGGKPVTSIGVSAFDGCSGLTSVTIPNSVTSIGGGAFSGCSGLTSVTIPNSVTNIGGSAFFNCSGLTSVTIPNSVTSIGNWAFETCSGLTSVTMPNSVTSIGRGAFHNCSGLTNVTIPNSVTSIGNWAFENCSGLTSVTIPNSVTSIGYRAFRGCSGLKSVTIPDSVTSIGDEVFENCSGLKSVTIPDSVTSIGREAFENCSGLKSVTIGNGVTSIGDEVFYFCFGLKSVTIGSGVKNIESYAFAFCTNLTSVTIPANVTSIGVWAFYECSKLTKITLPMWCKNTYVYRSGNEWRLTTEKIAGFEPKSWQEYLGLSSNAKITYKDVDGGQGGDGSATPDYEVLDATDIVAPYEVPKAVTLPGVVYGDDEVIGIVELKLGKVSKGKSKVAGSFTGLDGKKITIKAVSVTGIDGTAPATVSLEVKGLGTMTVTIGGDKFAGSLGKWHVQSGTVGGNWSKATATVNVVAQSATLPTGTIEKLLPDGETATVSGGKWSFAKAASVKWAKPKQGAALSEFYNEAAGKDLIVDDTKGKTNLSGLKLAYTPKKGTFKGKFSLYALEGAGKVTKLKKYTINVTGVVADGVGYGVATCKKPAVSWSVTVE